MKHDRCQPVNKYSQSATPQPSTRRLPAEWEPQSAILLTWPHENTDWAGQLPEVEQVYLNVAKAVLAEQDLIISCEDDAALKRVIASLSPLAETQGTQLKACQIPADDTWARDHGPIGIIEEGKLTLLDFNFNAWGGKYASSKDNNITQQLFDAGAFPNASYNKVNFVLEGGSIESDGMGTLMTSERCLLSDTRNSGFSKQEIATQLKQTLGATRILWLKNGYLAGDDTDAHIDTLARFCNPHTICYVSCDDPQDEHFAELKAMKEELESFKTADGKAYTLIPLPMASAMYDTNENNEKVRLPATYANFLIMNRAVLLPVYEVAEDKLAIEQLQHCFPDRKIITIDCRPLIKEHGSLHCITMQITQGAV